MWSSKDRLGSGATGEVYLGYHKVYWWEGVNQISVCSNLKINFG